MNACTRRIAAALVFSLVALSALGSAEAGVNAFWKELGGSASGGGISKLGANVSAESARVAFGADNLPVVVYGTGPVLSGDPRAISVARWTGTLWEDISPVPAVFGFEPRIVIAANGTRYISWLQDDGSGPQVHLLQRTASGTSWTPFGSLNSSAVTALTTAVSAHALAVGSDNIPVVAIDTLAQTGLFPFDEGVLQGTHQIYVLKVVGGVWAYLGGDPSTGGASTAFSLFVDGGTAPNGGPYATHEASSPALTVVNNLPTVAFVYSTVYTAGNAPTPIEFIPGNSEIFVTQYSFNASAWTAVGPAVPQVDDGGAARGGLGGASHLPSASILPSIAGRSGAFPILALTWQEQDSPPAIYARVLDGSDWVPFGPPGSDLVSDPLFQNFDPQIVVGPDGRAVVTWGAFDGLREQIFVKRSGPLGFEEMGPDSADGPGISDSPFVAQQPSVAAPTSGGPAAAWLDNPAGDNGFQVYLRQFSTAAAFRLTVNRTGAGANVSSVTSSPIGIDCGSDCSELFPSGTTVLLTPSAGSHAKFIGWTGCTSVSGTTCSALMNANKTVSANFAAANTVIVTRLGNGGVLVTSMPAGINCGPNATDCGELFTAGTAVTLNASVPTGTVFDGWTGDCAFRLRNLSCPLGVITADKSVVVNSSLQLYNIKVNVSSPTGTSGQGRITDITGDIDCGFGSPNICSELEEFGSQVALRAVAAPGSRFLNYTGTICSGSTNSSCNFAVSQNQTITGLFRAVTDLFVNKSGNGAARAGNRVTFVGNGLAGSSIDCGAGPTQTDCTGQAFTNSSVVFMATLATGTDLSPAGGACTWTGTGTTRSCSFIASGFNQSVNAVFTQQKRHLHVTGQINGIVVPGVSVFTTSTPPGIDCGNTGAHSDCDEDFDFGTSVALTPFEDDHTLFNHWTGCSRVNGSTCLLDMTANATVTKFFDYTNTLDIIALNNGSGTITTSLSGGTTSCNATGGGCTFERKVPTGAVGTAGTKVVVTPKPNVGTTFRWVSSDFGCTVGAATPCTASMATGNHSAIGSFTLNVHRIDVLRRANGSVVSVGPLPDVIDCQSAPGSDCTAELNFGTLVHLVATPADGFIFDRWQGVTCAGAAGAANTSCAFTVPDTNLSIAPFFRAHTAVSVTKAGNGKGTLAASIATGGTLKPTAPTCGESCSSLSFEAFDNRLVTLKATESVGSRFDGFSGECVSNTSTCTYLPSGDTDSIVATFTLRQFLTTVFNNPNGSVVSTNLAPDVVNCGAGNFDCDTTQNFGQLVTLLATPLDGFTFTGWTTTPAALCNNVVGSTNPSCTFRVPNANTTVRANFRLRTLVNLTRTGNGAGTVTSTPAGITCGTDCSEAFFDGKLVSLLAAPSVGSSFGGFGGITCSSNASSCSFVPSGSVQNISATFTLRQFAINVFNNPNGSVVSTPPLGGVIDCGGGSFACDTTQNFGQLVTLTTDPNVGFGFSGWVTTPAGLCSNTNATCSFKVPLTNVSVRANFRLRTAVSVVRTGAGTGTVTSNPAGISCGADCTETFFDGRSVTFTATPTAPGSTFGGFSGACVSNTSTCTYIPSGDSQTVTATFNKAPALINLRVTGDGSVTRGVDSCDSNDGVCTFPGLFGESVVFVAHPSAGNRLVSFTGCTSMSNASTCTVTQAGTKNVSATFSFAIFVAKLGDGTGTVAPNPAGTSCGLGCTNYTPGTSVILTETPTGGSAFGGWGDECAFRGFNTSCTLVANQNRVVSASFFKPVTLIVTRSGAGTGTVTSSPAGITCGADCTNPYAFNTLVTLTASPGSGSVFGGFTGCDSLVGNFSCRVSMTSNRTVDAAFNPPSATLTVQTPGHGTVTATGINCGTGGADCSETYTGGTALDLTAAADSGFFFNGWGGACASFGSASICTLTMNGNRTVSATFAPQSVINVLFDGAGQGAVDLTGAAPCVDTCTRFVDPGTPVFLTPSPAPGSVFGEWGGDCAGTPRNESCALFSPGFGNFTVTTSYLANPVSVSVLGDNHVVIHSDYNGGAGHGTPFIATKDCDSPCDLLVESGTQVTFTAQPRPGIIFNNWLLDCASFNSSDFCFLNLSGNGSVVATSSSLNQSTLTILVDGDVASRVDTLGDAGEIQSCTSLTQPCTQLYASSEQVGLTQSAPGVPGALLLGFLPGGTAGQSSVTVGLGADPLTVTSYVSANTRKQLEVIVAGSAVSGLGFSVTTFDGAPVTNGGCDGSCVITELDPGLRVTLFPSIDATQGVFFGWGGDCAGFTADQACEVVMSRNKSATIVYAALPAPADSFSTLTLVANASTGSGCVSANGPTGSSGCLGSGVAVFARGASVDLVTAAQPGSVFSNFEGNCTFSDGDTIVMDHSCTLIANFVVPTSAPR